MKRYSVKIREVHEQQIFVSAKDADDAKEKAAEGVGDLANGRYDQGQGPNCPSGNTVIWGGSANGSPYSNICEEWSDPVYTIKTVTVS